MSLEDQLQSDLAHLAAQHLTRKLRVSSSPGPTIQIDGRSLLHAASNDYLGLARHPALAAASAAATQTQGVGAGASRLISGHLAIHESTETLLAQWKGSEAALLLPTGFMANLAALTTLAGSEDLIVQDKLNHASLVDAARFSGASVRTYPHLGLAKAERLLADGQSFRRRFLVTDSVFSMDGDAADLVACADLCRRYDATLVVDEAHATGVFGTSGSGLIEGLGLKDHPAVRQGVTISTASKALGGLGGMVTGSATLISALVHLARPFLFTTAIPPAQTAAIQAAIVVVQNEPERRARLIACAAHVRTTLLGRGWTLPASRHPTPIIPLIVGTPEAALALGKRLKECGIFALPVRYPAVPAGTARVRVTLRADWTDGQVEELLAAIGKPSISN